MADGVIKGGTSNSETVQGTAFNDSLYGNGGADILLGLDGDDRLESGTIYDAATNSYLPDLVGDTLDGGNGNDILRGGSGRDKLAGGAGTNNIDGGAGLDIAIYNGARSAYTVNVGAGVSVSGGGINDTISGVERLVFSDRGLALDIDGNAGKMFRLYQAAFDRAPDLVGLGFWIDAADRGEPWMGMAHGFTVSAEFDRLYGVNASNDVYLTALYRNALHRTPDADGYQFWIDALNRGVSRESVLIDFAESAENKAQVIGSIEHGIDYVPWA